MNAKERDIVAYLICLADEAGVPVKDAIEELSKLDLKFFAAYDSWQKTLETDAGLVEEYHRRMHDEFGADWALTKNVTRLGKEIWENIVQSA